MPDLGPIREGPNQLKRENDMTDIVKKLRDVGKDYDFHENALVYEAADEIESLRREREYDRVAINALELYVIKLTEALQVYDCDCDLGDEDDCEVGNWQALSCGMRARKALKDVK